MNVLSFRDFTTKFHSDNRNLQRISDELLKDRRKIPDFATDEELFQFIRFSCSRSDIRKYFEIYRDQHQASVLNG